mgnify:FL=1|tara:strand:- start:160 stop:672 length:513 start_codon:yes stop_codon:yes gene_type:complete
MPFKDKEKRKEYERKRMANWRYVRITNAEVELLGLPKRIYGKTTREDGYVFKQYYYRINPKGEKSKPYELWCSPKTIANERIVKAAGKKRMAEKNKKFILRVKSKLGCSKCGYKKCTDALHFHHVIKEDKKREISVLKGGSLKALKEELRKCVVYCANCHAEHHYNERME